MNSKAIWIVLAVCIYLRVSASGQVMSDNKSTDPGKIQSVESANQDQQIGVDLTQFIAQHFFAKAISEKIPFLGLAIEHAPLKLDSSIDKEGVVRDATTEAVAASSRKAGQLIGSELLTEGLPALLVAPERAAVVMASGSEETAGPQLTDPRIYKQQSDEALEKRRESQIELQYSLSVSAQHIKEIKGLTLLPGPPKTTIQSVSPLPITSASPKSSPTKPAVCASSYFNLPGCR